MRARRCQTKKRNSFAGDSWKVDYQIWLTCQTLEWQRNELHVRNLWRTAAAFTNWKDFIDIFLSLRTCNYSKSKLCGSQSAWAKKISRANNNSVLFLCPALTRFGPSFLVLGTPFRLSIDCLCDTRRIKIFPTSSEFIFKTIRKM